jgi:hypothetical protein
MLEWDGLVSNWFYCANCYYYLSTIDPVWNHIFKLFDIKLPMLGNHLIRLSAGVVILSREFMYTRTGRSALEYVIRNTTIRAEFVATQMG